MLSKKILLVEDNPIQQKVIGSMLKRVGYSFDLAETGKQTLNFVATSSYCLILMDIELPDINGIEIAKKIRDSIKSEESVPIVALTSHADRNTKDRCLKIMNGFANKPIGQKQLYELIQHYAILK